MTRLSIGEAIQQVVGVLSETGDTSEVLRATARAARQMMLADEAYLLLREGGRLVLRAADGLPEGLVGHSFIRSGEGIEGWVAEHGEPVALSDVGRERRYRDLPGRKGHVHALAVVPMKLRDDVVGILATAGEAPFPPAGSRLTGLEILASIAAVTIENDRLLLQERRRLHQAEVLLDLSGVQDPELLPSLQKVTDAISSALAVEDTELMVMERDGSQLTCRGGRDSFATVDTGNGQISGLAARIFSTGEPILCDDVALNAELGPQFRRSGMRSLLAAPIQVRGERRGVLRVTTRQVGSFRPEDMAFLTLIASQVGLLVERTDLARRHLEVSREQARQQARQEFLGLVSHELKTPVAVLKAYLELLERKSEIDPSRGVEGEVLGRMLEQTDRMLAMIEQLLDLQRIETGQLALEVSHFDLGELARRVAESVQLTARTHRIEVTTGGRMPVVADRRRTEEVLFNLLENAVKYSPEGSRIAVNVDSRPARSGREEVLVSVQDQGVGILQQDLERIFERFYQGQGRLHRGHMGLGLGLYIAREIIERHDGKVWAESAEGAGSTFCFTLPIAVDSGD